MVYKQTEGAFSNPNAFMAESTLEWLCECSRTVVREKLGGGGGVGGGSGGGSGGGGGGSETSTTEHLPSLLELYCGNGNHTVALAAMYRRVAAVVGPVTRAWVRSDHTT